MKKIKKIDIEKIEASEEELSRRDIDIKSKKIIEIIYILHKEIAKTLNQLIENQEEIIKRLNPNQK